MKGFGGELKEIWIVFAFFDTLLSSCYIEEIQPEIWHELWAWLSTFQTHVFIGIFYQALPPKNQQLMVQQWQSAIWQKQEERGLGNGIEEV